MLVMNTDAFLSANLEPLLLSHFITGVHTGCVWPEYETCK